MRIFKSIFYLFILCAIFPACSIIKPSQVKQAEKEEKAKIKESEKAYLLLQEEHMARQSVKTQERMEFMKKRSEYKNRAKEKPGFFKRIFGKRNKKR